MSDPIEALDLDLAIAKRCRLDEEEAVDQAIEGHPLIEDGGGYHSAVIHLLRRTQR